MFVLVFPLLHFLVILVTYLNFIHSCIITIFSAVSPVLVAEPWIELPNPCKFPTSQTIRRCIGYVFEYTSTYVHVELYRHVYVHAWVCLYKQFTTHALTTSFLLMYAYTVQIHFHPRVLYVCHVYACV